MKKTYLVPALEEQKLNTELMIAGSITAISGVDGIEIAGEDTEGLVGDVKAELFSNLSF